MALVSGDHLTVLGRCRASSAVRRDHGVLLIPRHSRSRLVCSSKARPSLAKSITMAWSTPSARSSLLKGKCPRLSLCSVQLSYPSHCRFGRLYRGLAPPLMLEAPKRAVKFAANDFWGQTFRKTFKQDKMSQGLSVLTGCSAGATESIGPHL
jgi:hypothetical protein